jgi:hypothetical protein
LTEEAALLVTSRIRAPAVAMATQAPRLKFKETSNSFILVKKLEQYLFGGQIETPRCTTRLKIE